MVRPDGAGLRTELASQIRDVFCALRARLWWLTGLPLLAGVAALAVAWAQPHAYTSVATLTLDDARARKADAFMRTGPVVDAVRKVDPADTSRFQWSTTTGEPRRTATVFNLTVKDRDPVSAQAVGNALIAGWLELTKPRPEEMARLVEERERTKDDLRETEGLIKKASPAKDTRQKGAAPPVPVAPLLARRDTLLLAIAKIDRDMRGTSRDVVLVEPSPPTSPDPTRAGLLAGLAAGLVFLLTGAIVMWHLATERWARP